MINSVKSKSAYLWSGRSQLNAFSLSMFVSLALLGKNSARSVARMQCLMLPRTCRYSSGFSLEKMLWFSWIKLTKIIDFFAKIYSLKKCPPAAVCWLSYWSGGAPSSTWSRLPPMETRRQSWTYCWSLGGRDRGRWRQCTWLDTRAKQNDNKS